MQARAAPSVIMSEQRGSLLGSLWRRARVVVLLSVVLRPAGGSTVRGSFDLPFTIPGAQYDCRVAE